jgi:hypothetical protein
MEKQNEGQDDSILPLFGKQHNAHRNPILRVLRTTKIECRPRPLAMGHAHAYLKTAEHGEFALGLQNESRAA